MKKSTINEENIVWALQQWDSGARVYSICDKLGISVGTLYAFRKKYGGLDVATIKRIRELESERFKLVKKLGLLEQDKGILRNILREEESDSNQFACNLNAQQQAGFHNVPTRGQNV